MFVIRIYSKIRNILDKLKKSYFFINNIMILYGSYIYKYKFDYLTIS